MTAVCHFQQAVSGSASQYFTVFTKQKAGHVTWYNVSVDVFYFYVVETVAVESLKCTIHTHVKQTVLVLYNAVDIITGHSVLYFLLFLQNMELVTIIFVQAVSGGYPYKTVMIQIYLARKTA